MLFVSLLGLAIVVGLVLLGIRNPKGPTAQTQRQSADTCAGGQRQKLFQSIESCLFPYQDNVRNGIQCQDYSCTYSIELEGEIQTAAVDRIRRLLEDRRGWIAVDSEKRSGMFGINSPGGSVTAAMAIGRLLRKERASLIIGNDQECISACVLILAGAVQRIIGRASVGIHRPYFEGLNGSQSLRPEKVRELYDGLLQSIRSYLREMYVSEQLADDMLRIEPADVRYLSPSELDGYGLSWNDPVEQETVDLKEAQELGLDRREYIRRQGLRKALCYPLTNYNQRIMCIDRVMKFGG
jgi:ATP-dependent protease ClpP protease subunit